MFDKTCGRLVLCADDFGLSQGIDRAVVKLVARGRLSATSCMVGGATFPHAGPALQEIRRSADIGLHLTLTDLAPLGPMPKLAPDGRLPRLGGLLATSLAGRLEYREIKAEIGRQLARFEAVAGRLPDFIDGHQHAHVLPTVRRALLDLLAERAPAARPRWLRTCEEPFGWILRRAVEPAKAAFIALLSHGMARDAARLGIATNDSFRGVSDFGRSRPFSVAFPRFLAGPGVRPLVMCHPAVPGFATDPSDTIMAARTAEYAYLGGEAFDADLERASVTIGRFGES